MDRLKEKLTRAAGVAPRVTSAIEADADRLIAREDELASKRAKAFAPHHAMLDSHNRDLDQLEDALQIVSNGAPPLEDSLNGSGESVEPPKPPPATKPPEHLKSASVAAASPPEAQPVEAGSNQPGDFRG